MHTVCIPTSVGMTFDNPMLTRSSQYYAHTQSSSNKYVHSSGDCPILFYESDSFSKNANEMKTFEHS